MAGRQRQHGCDGHGHQRQRYRQSEALQDEFGHRRAVRVGQAQVAHHQAADPVPVALDGRAVYAQFLGERLHHFRRSVRPHQDLGGVSRKDFQHQEDHHGCAYQRRNQGDQALEQENTHEAADNARSVREGPSWSTSAWH